MTTTEPRLLTGARPPALPAARGPVSAALLGALARPPHDLAPLPAAGDHPLWGDDSALALYACYELHYRGFDGVDDGWEWSPALLRERAALEAAFEAGLLAEVGPVTATAEDALDVLAAMARAGNGGPSLSATMLRDGSVEQLREFAVHRSAWQLKEADPHSWGIPRLVGRAKAAFVAIQAGEYGDGVASRQHAELFAATMRGLGLDPTYGHYLDRLPGTTLATVNLVSFLGLHRRWRGALAGHLALFEMCSVGPMGRYRDACARFGLDPSAAEFYAVHVTADAVHQVIAFDELAGGLVAEQPELAADLVFGAMALERMEARFAGHLLDSWAAGRSSLLPPGP